MSNTNSRRYQHTGYARGRRIHHSFARASLVQIASGVCPSKRMVQDFSRKRSVLTTSSHAAKAAITCRDAMLMSACVVILRCRAHVLASEVTQAGDLNDGNSGIDPCSL